MKKVKLLLMVLGLGLVIWGCGNSRTLEVSSYDTGNTVYRDPSDDYIYIKGKTEPDTKIYVLFSDYSKFKTEKSDKNGNFKIGIPGIVPKETYYLSIDKEAINKKKVNKETTKKVTVEIDPSKKGKPSSKSESSESSEETESSEESQSESAAESTSSAEPDLSQYRSDITYEQLARTPKDYKNEKLTLTGSVAQVQEDKKEVDLRIAIDGNIDNIVYVALEPKILNGTRILEDDLVTFYGTSKGVTTYESTMGQDITIPLVIADSINDQGAAPEDYGY